MYGSESADVVFEEMVLAGRDRLLWTRSGDKDCRDSRSGKRNGDGGSMADMTARSEGMGVFSVQCDHIEDSR